MNFFKRNILKVKSETDEDGVNFYVNYFKIDKSDNFKMLLLKEMMGSNNCLAVINTEMNYTKNNRDNEKISNELTDALDKVDIKYKKIQVKKTKDLVIFGAVVRGTNKDVYKQNIIGIIIESEKLENINYIMRNCNINYYIDYNVCSDDELLCKFQSQYNDMEELRASNTFDIFDDNFTKSIVIHSRPNDSKFVMDILDRLKERL